jgi:hypothetical protein
MIKEVEYAWIRGFCTALADMHRLLLHGNNSEGLREIARSAGVSLNSARRAGPAKWDVDELVKAGIE